MEPHFKSIMDHLHDEKFPSYLDLTPDSHSILCEILKDYDKMFDDIVVPSHYRNTFFKGATQVLDIMILIDWIHLIRDNTTGKV